LLVTIGCAAFATRYLECHTLLSSTALVLRSCFQAIAELVVEGGEQSAQAVLENVSVRDQEASLVLAACRSILP
jgi:hypothetical protein